MSGLVELIIVRCDRGPSPIQLTLLILVRVEVLGRYPTYDPITLNCSQLFIYCLTFRLLIENREVIRTVWRRP
jgi:hypothetical protein